jgi:hypothetical protein
MAALRFLRIVGLGVGLLALPSCRVNTQPVMNVEHPIYKNHGQLEIAAVREKIVAGLDDKGWGVIDESDGWMVAEVRDDEHWARVRITYDENHYTIIHFESHPDFEWNGKTIHRRYNSWVENLDEAIADQFEPEDDDDDDDDDDDEDLETQLAAEPAAAAAIAESPAPAPQAAAQPSAAASEAPAVAAEAAAPPPAAPPEAPPG